MAGAEATSVEGVRSLAVALPVGVPSRAGTSIRASIGNLGDARAAPYSASAALSLASTSVTVSVTLTQGTTLPGSHPECDVALATYGERRAFGRRSARIDHDADIVPILDDRYEITERQPPLTVCN
jgi:hypothetical protein